MARSTSRCCWLLLLAILAIGCRLPGHEGPVPRSVADCRRLSQRGIAAAERGQAKQAADLLEKAVDACPVDGEARRHYAEALWQQGHRHQAVEQLTQATQLIVEDATLWVRLAEMQLALGETDKAGRSAEQALDLNPKLPGAWAVRAQIRRAAGQTHEALADYHRALGYAPDNREILLALAELYRELNQPQRALNTLHILANTYSPGEEPQQVLYLTGLAYSALRRYRDAVEVFSTASLREQPNPELYYRLAEAELGAGRTVEAAAAAHQALRLAPNHPPSQALLQRVEVAQRTQSTRR